jgi:phosphate/sulfate permease
MDLYLFIVLILFALAITDLIVGVSNDAVNFLNSAIGSKVAPRHIIMIVASAGIFVGATFSSGMMEVARKGIFNPDFFFFDEIMVIFLAVMLTDIILLDLFNTFGMPTSTTVSIVFELLGSSVAIAVLKVIQQGDSIVAVGDYINSGSAMIIIAGIFLSVTIAFVVGSLVQWLSRLLFSFQYQKRMKWVGALWSGLALATLTYFLLVKGAKGASFLSQEVIDWVGANTITIFLGSFLGWTALMQLLHSIFKLDMLRVVVLFGTFSLAMAFAGNDLVNFIGVPIAGFESYLSWTDSGVGAEDFNMGILKEAVRTPTYLLLIAGTIMILTLWFSKKARSVTETEVNLGRQDDGAERFAPNALAQGIVRIARNVGQAFRRLIPQTLRNKAEENFKPYKAPVPKGELPAAFDMVRASVNLTTASMLIALATSLKLPLSTTYVSFMVAMGTSLADRAWGRDSAVFRVSGVLNVIGGWFLTAIIAFTVAGFFAVLIFWLGAWAIGGLLILALFLISRTFILHRKKEKEKAETESFEREDKTLETDEVIPELASKIKTLLQTIVKTYEDATEGLLNEDRDRLQLAKADLVVLQEQNETFRKRLYKSIQRLADKLNGTSRLYLLLYDYEEDILQSIQLIVKTSYDYVSNSLNPLTEKQQEEIRTMKKEVSQYIAFLIEAIPDRSPEQKAQIKERKAALLLQIENLLSEQVQGIKEKKYGSRNSDMYLSLMMETKDLLAVATRFVKLFARLRKSEQDQAPQLLVEPEE